MLFRSCPVNRILRHRPPVIGDSPPSLRPPSPPSPFPPPGSIDRRHTENRSQSTAGRGWNGPSRATSHRRLACEEGTPRPSGTRRPSLPSRIRIGARRWQLRPVAFPAPPSAQPGRGLGDDLIISPVPGHPKHLHRRIPTRYRRVFPQSGDRPPDVRVDLHPPRRTAIGSQHVDPESRGVMISRRQWPPVRARGPTSLRLLKADRMIDRRIRLAIGGQTPRRHRLYAITGRTRSHQSAAFKDSFNIHGFLRQHNCAIGGDAPLSRDGLREQRRIERRGLPP